MRNVHISECDFSPLPENLREGLNEYSRLWGLGDKKRANAVLRSAMNGYDSAGDTVHKLFADIICSTLCDNNCSAPVSSRIPFEINTRLKEYLSGYIPLAQLPEARWYCEIYGDIDAATELFRRHPDDAVTAELLMSHIIHFLRDSAHELPIGCLCSEDEYHNICALATDILQRFPMSEDPVSDFYHYKKQLDNYFVSDN